MAKTDTSALVMGFLVLFSQLSGPKMPLAQEAPAQTEPSEPEFSVQCYECSGYNGESPNPDCSMEDYAGYSVSDATCYGACFTTSNTLDNRDAGRGCTSSLGLVTAELPDTGCYDWQGATICLCYYSYCNMDPLGQSSGTPFKSNSATAATPAATSTAAASVTSTTTASTALTKPTTTPTTTSTTTTTTTRPTTPTTTARPTTGPTTTTSATPRTIITTAVQTQPNPATEPPEPEFSVQCYECSSYNGETPNPDCSMDDYAGYSAPDNICYGACFTKSDALNNKDAGRGCTSTLELVTAEIPDAGCYDWQGATICLCYYSYCNMDPLGQSSGTPFNTNSAAAPAAASTAASSLTSITTASTATPTTTTSPTTGPTTTTSATPSTIITTAVQTQPNPATEPPEPEFSVQCYECSSYNGGTLDPECSMGDYAGYSIPDNICYGACFTKSDALNNKDAGRGCTSSLGLVTAELLDTGCYDWQGATICLCYYSYCNMDPLGQSSGIPFYTIPVALPTKMTTAPTTIKDTTVVTTQTTSEYFTMCAVCASKVDGVTNPLCPKDSMLLPSQTPPVRCTGVCFTKSDATDPTLVFRGCTVNETGLPSPLPGNGCYDWKGATFCICQMPMCNMNPIGQSTGKPLDPNEPTAKTTVATSTAVASTTLAGVTTGKPLLPTTTAQATTKPTTAVLLPPAGENFPVACFDCTNYFNNSYNEWCPKDGAVIESQAYSGKCKGPCFTRSTMENSKIVVRGCTANLGTLPSPLPSEGCYDWNGATFCICYSEKCNIKPLGTSSGVSLDAHLTSDQPGEGTSSGPLQCYECMNYNADGSLVLQCPKDGRVNSQTVYRGNCTGACFTRTFSDNSTKVARGCTASQWGLPNPLPPPGCYNRDGETWCICNTTHCNGGPIGVSSGRDFDAHLYEIADNFVEPDGIKKCYQCLNYFKGVYYPQCEKDSRVKNAYLAPCNGTCFTRTYDQDARIVARGCTDSQWGLPNPLPHDGCYYWYSEIWCVCSKSRCNGAALGNPKDAVQFDAHIKTEGGGASSVMSNKMLFILPLLILIRASK